jgi:lysophospholipase L1-like esterase
VSAEAGLGEMSPSCRSETICLRITAPDGLDGIHLTAAAHKAIGTGVSEKVKAILK